MDENTDATLDELGPVDYLVVEFPAGEQNFTGEVADELGRLAEPGIIRILDVLILQKNEDGSVDALEIDDMPGRRDPRPRDRDRRDPRRRGRRAPGRRDAARQRRRCRGLGEPLGGAVRECHPSSRWPAHRHRPDPDPGHRRIHRGRTGRRTRELTCRSVQHVPHDEE